MDVRRLTNITGEVRFPCARARGSKGSDVFFPAKKPRDARWEVGGAKAIISYGEEYLCQLIPDYVLMFGV
jgi:hypothetical protein